MHLSARPHFARQVAIASAAAGTCNSRGAQLGMIAVAIVGAAAAMVATMLALRVTLAWAACHAALRFRRQGQSGQVVS